MRTKICKFHNNYYNFIQSLFRRVWREEADVGKVSSKFALILSESNDISDGLMRATSRMQHLETNEEFWLDTSNEVARKQFQKLRNDNNLEFLEYCKKNNFDIIPISTSSDFVKPIVNYLNNRDKK